METVEDPPPDTPEADPEEPQKDVSPAQGTTVAPGQPDKPPDAPEEDPEGD